MDVPKMIDILTQMAKAEKENINGYNKAVKKAQQEGKPIPYDIDCKGCNQPWKYTYAYHICF